MFSNEIATYEVMAEHQGSLTPILQAAVDLDISLPGSVHAPELGNLDPFRVKGILLDFIDGCNLDAVAQNFPRSTWQGIVDEALGIVRTMDNMNILKKDVAERNFIVSAAPDSVEVGEQGESTEPHVYIIDLAMCRLRRADESDGDWGRAKNNTLEESFADFVKKDLKRDHNFELDFNIEFKYLKYGDTECADYGHVRYDHVCPTNAKFL